MSTAAAAAPLPRRRLAVFCGSRLGNDRGFAAAATALGTALAARGIGLVYGGAQVGSMGLLAAAALAAGGEVIGVMPRGLADQERAHRGLTQLIEVDGLAARKAQMAALSQGCIALPGGIGTLDEFFELWTAAYLGTYAGPVGLCNVAGYFDGLLAHLDAQVAAGFLPATHRHSLHVAAGPEALLDRMESGTQTPEEGAGKALLAGIRVIESAPARD